MQMAVQQMGAVGLLEVQFFGGVGYKRPLILPPRIDYNKVWNFLEILFVARCQLPKQLKLLVHLQQKSIALL
jgi:hypothetical protein